jgi:hypothetical protein
MAKTIEQLDKEYEGKEEDRDYLELQARLGSEKDAEKAYDENGNFHCIHWFDCQFCPAFNSENCL